MEEIKFNTYVLPLGDRMFRYAQSELLSAAEAEDAVADLLERLWVERSRLAGCRNIDSFVLTALRNRCYDLLRSRRARSRRDDAFGEGIERATMGESGVWEIREQVRRAIASLPERQREAVHLKDIEGYPTREVAELLGCDEAQVRVLLSRARSALREILQKMMDDGQAKQKH